MYDRDKLIDRILELDGKVSKQAERIKALEEGLQNLVNAIPGDGTWNYQAAMESARKLLTQ